MLVEALVGVAGCIPHHSLGRVILDGALVKAIQTVVLSLHGVVVASGGMLRTRVPFDVQVEQSVSQAWKLLRQVSLLAFEIL